MCVLMLCGDISLINYDRFLPKNIDFYHKKDDSLLIKHTACREDSLSLGTLSVCEARFCHREFSTLFSSLHRKKISY